VLERPNIYYYQVTAFSNWCAGTPAYNSVSVAMSYNAPAPSIIPFGGTFYDSVDVLVTNTLAGTTIYYTTNGNQPGGSSDSFVGGGMITLADSVPVKACASNPSYYYNSSTVSANFIIMHPSPVSCGDTISDALTDTNAYSPELGWGWYCRRYSFNGTNSVGKLVTVTASTTDFYSLVILEDADSNIMDWNCNYYDGAGPDDQLQFHVFNEGTYFIEVTSWFAEQFGDFTLSLDCSNETIAILNVFTNACVNGQTLFTTNSGRLPIGGLMDFSMISAGTHVTNYVTLTNSGNCDLVISNITIAPAALINGGNGFSIFPTNIIILHAGDITNLAVSLYATNWANFGGYFTFDCNDADTSFFYAYVTGQVSPPASAPWVNIDYPTDGLVIPATNSVLTNITLEIDAEAYDLDGILKVEFYIDSVLFKTLSNVSYYTVYWTNPPAGLHVIKAVAYDPQQTGTNSVTITVGYPTLILSPTNACVGLSNTTFTVTATLYNTTNGLVSGSNVTFAVTGAHNLTYTTNTSGGYATFTYTGTNAGLDAVTASAAVAGVAVQSDPIHKNWAKYISCGNTLSGVLANTDGTSIACGCEYPSHYTDFYSFTTTVGATNTFKMASSDFTTFMFLMDTNCKSIAVTNEMLNTNDVEVRAILHTNGTYIVEATSADIFKTGNYTLSLVCGPPTTPHITVWVNGTNFANSSMLNLGTTTNGTAITRTIGITNTGGAALCLTNYSWYYGPTNGYTITLAPGLGLAPGTGTNFTLQFISTNSGQFEDRLILTNNDSDQPLFAVYLNAISNPDNTNGSAPVVSLTAPTNNAWFYAPADISLSATATPSGSSVTITNVEFGYWNGQGWDLIGRDTNTPYSTVWSANAAGTYTLAAVAWDSLGRMAFSTPVTNIQLRLSNTNHPPKANKDIVTVLCNSRCNLLDVLANDTDADGDPLTIVNYKLSTLSGPRGTVKIVDNGKHLLYTPVPGYGTNDPNCIQDGFSYEISDGKGGTNWGGVLVVIYASPMPHIEISNPPDGATLTAGTITNVMWTNWPAEAVSNIARVEFYDHDDIIGAVTNAPFTSWPWLVRYNSCECGLKARVVDKFGQYSEDLVHYTIIGTSDTNLPVPYATISSPSVLSESPLITPSGGKIERNAEVTDGMLVIIGSVYQAIGSGTPFAVQYKVLIKTTDGTILRDSGWRPAALIQNGLICTNDLTTLQNDNYVVELIAQNDYQIASFEVPFILNSGLKLGVFTFSEQDLVIPAGGMPLSVIRTYNSLNPNPGDFGYSWTYALQELNVTFHEDREWVRPADDSIDDVGPTYNGAYFSIREGGSRDITLTLPNGQRTRFYYYEQACGSINAYACPNYYAPPEAHARLQPVDANGNELGGRLGLINGYYVWSTSGGNTPYDSFDFPAFLLTLDDGTEYFIVRDYQGAFDVTPGDDGTDDWSWTSGTGYYYKAYTDKARVAWIKLPSGEKIVITDPTTSPIGSQFSVNYLNVAGTTKRSI